MDFTQIFDHGWGLLMVVLFFGGSIFVHELGHFLAAKWRGLHIERFSIGFGPKIFGWTRGGVDYRLSWLPLGGYVALPQLADMRGIEGETSQSAHSLPPISFTDKVIVSVAGAVFNIVFALVLATTLFFTGRYVYEDSASTTVGYLSETLSNTEGERVPAPAKSAGMQLGDKILSIDGTDVGDWPGIRQAIALSTGRTDKGERLIEFVVERGDKVKTLFVEPIISEGMKLRQVGLGPAHTVIVSALYPGSPATAAGMETGDVILSLDGKRIFSRSHYESQIEGNAGKALSVTLLRDGERVESTITPQEVVVWSDGRTETLSGIYAYDRNRELVHQPPLDQIGEVAATTWTTLSTLANRNSDIGISHMSGPVGIIRVIHTASQYSILDTLWIVIFINVSLAFFNLLPIPVLDGGHILFAAISKLRNKPINPNLLASLQGSFMILLFGMMIYVTFFDFSRWATDSSRRSEYRETRVQPVFSPQQ